MTIKGGLYLVFPDPLGTPHSLCSLSSFHSSPTPPEDVASPSHHHLWGPSPICKLLTSHTEISFGDVWTTEKETKCQFRRPSCWHVGARRHRGPGRYLLQVVVGRHAPLEGLESRGRPLLGVLGGRRDLLSVGAGVPLPSPSPQPPLAYLFFFLLIPSYFSYLIVWLFK